MIYFLSTVVLAMCLTLGEARAAMTSAVTLAGVGGDNPDHNSDHNLDRCEDDSGGLERQIAACTWLLNSLEMNIDAYKAAHFRRGDAYSFQGRFDQAIRDYGDAIQLRPKSPGVFLNRAYAFTYTAQYSRAVRDYETSIRLNPLADAAYNDLAWLLATAPDAAIHDGVRAVSLARWAIKLNNSAANIDTLAAAYARSGRYNEAAVTQEQAIVAHRANDGAGHILDSYQERLEMFRAGRPYHVELN